MVKSKERGLIKHLRDPLYIFVGTEFSEVKVSNIGIISEIDFGCWEYLKYSKLRDDFEEFPRWKESYEIKLDSHLQN